MTQLKKNKNVLFVAIAVVALAAGGAALAATKVHGARTARSSMMTVGKVYASSTIKRRGFGDRDRIWRRRDGDELAAASSYLGVARTDLITQLQAGKTLALIAETTSGKSAPGLVDALVAAEKTELDAAVKADRITQAQEDRIVPALTARFTALLNKTRPARGSGGPDLRHGRRRGRLAAAATYLGITERTLATQLQGGKSLAQVADATSGKSAAGLIDALVARRMAKVDAALRASRITQAQHDQIVARLKARVTALVNRTRPADGSHNARRI